MTSSHHIGQCRHAYIQSAFQKHTYSVPLYALLLITVPYFHLGHSSAPTAWGLLGAANEVALAFSSQRVGPEPKLSQPDSPLQEFDSSFSVARKRIGADWYQRWFPKTLHISFQNINPKCDNNKWDMMWPRCHYHHHHPCHHPSTSSVASSPDMPAPKLGR